MYEFVCKVFGLCLPMDEFLSCFYQGQIATRATITNMDMEWFLPPIRRRRLPLDQMIKEGMQALMGLQASDLHIVSQGGDALRREDCDHRFDLSGVVGPRADHIQKLVGPLLADQYCLSGSYATTGGGKEEG